MFHNMHKKILLHSFLIASFLICAVGDTDVVQAQEKVDYGSDEAIVDTDLDGLTDRGEEQLFGTDIHDPDTDDDGFYDGVEHLQQTDPLDATDPLVTQFVETIPDTSSERAPLAWYFSRATGIVSYIFLWLVLFLGFSFRNPLLKRFVAPLYKLDMHIYLSLLTTGFVVFHGAVLVFDKYIGLSFAEIFIPYLSQSDKIDTDAIAWGILALYGILLLVITSLLRKWLPLKLWRFLHFFHVAVYILVIIHALAIGTDLQSGVVQKIFLGSVVILGLIYIISLIEMIVRLVKNKQHQNASTQ